MARKRKRRFKRFVLVLSIAFMGFTAFFWHMGHLKAPPPSETLRPDRSRILDGEGVEYRSDTFEVRRPTPLPYPDLVGSTLYAYFSDGPGRHVQQHTDHIYEQGWPFTENMGAVKQGGSWGFIDYSWKYVIEPRFEWALPFIEELAAGKVPGQLRVHQRERAVRH
jgi:hypothetical protein